MPTHQTKTGKEVSESAKGCAKAVIVRGNRLTEFEKLEGDIAEIIQMHLDAQLANARNDAIEECAKECESSVESYSQEAIDGSLYLLARTRTALRLASRIRALKKGPNP